jgi:hypothetical protein
VTGRWRIADVDLLPWPHCPFKCRWYERFRILAPEETPIRECQAVARDLARSLSSAEIRQCGYHRFDWQRIANAAVALAESGDTSAEAISKAVASHELDDDDAMELWMLFGHPIFLAGASLGNGQHRVCAMKLAGVQRCPIEV